MEQYDYGNIMNDDVISCANRFNQVFRVSRVDRRQRIVYIDDHGYQREIPFVDIVGHWIEQEME